MSLNISTALLRSLITLTEKREKLADDLASCEKQIAAAIGGAAGTISTPKVQIGTEGGNGRTAKATKKRGKRGAVGELILAGLKAAGEAGIAVKHLALKLGFKPQNIHVWLHTTGKKRGLIEAASKGVYRLKQSVGAVPQSSLKTPKLKITRKIPKTRKRKTAKRS